MPYDSDGNWVMTPSTYEPDQCAECRCPPGADHHPDCDCADPAPTIMVNTDREWDVPLWKQARLYGERIDAVLDELQAMLAPGSMFRDRVIEAGFERLLTGYEDYGSAMYHWSPEQRLREMVEEVADYGVYGTSGERR